MKKIAISLLLLGCVTLAYSQGSNRAIKQANKFAKALYYISNYYLDSVNFDAILDVAIKGAIKELDPHSSYLTSEDVKALNEPLQAKFEGVGIQYSIIRDTLTVQTPISGGPSERVGIRGGDKIVAINGEDITKIKLTNKMVQNYLRGKSGTKVNLSVVRRGVKEPLSFVVVRGVIPIHSVDAVYQPQRGITYIKLSRFANNSSDEIIHAIKSYPPTKGLILDLRGNSGGYLYSAVEIVNEFLSYDQLIVYTEGRGHFSRREYADGKGSYQTGPLVVLIDENSASSSEIVAGAIQDQDRGIIVGRRSFGKGLVQSTFPFGDGSELRLTVSRYHTPSGRVIQSPYELGEKDEYYKRFRERYSHGESFSADSISFPDSLIFRTRLHHRAVYGGGGIMPDLFVPQDTSHYTPSYSALIRNGVVIDYANEVADRNRLNWLERYPTSKSFIKNFDIDDSLFGGLVELAYVRGIEIQGDEIEKSKEDLTNYLKGLIANSLYEREAFYMILHQRDPEFIKGLEVVNHYSRYYQELIGG